MEEIIFMTQSEWFFQTNEFLETVSGRNEFGIPQATMMLRIGGSEDSQAIEVDLGPVVLKKNNMQGCYILTVSFSDQAKLRQCTEQFEKYANYVDIVSGTVDDDHMLSVLVMENDENKTGYVVGLNPVFFAQTASEPLGHVDSYRMSFRKDCMFYYGIEDISSDDNADNDVENEDDEFYSEETSDTYSGM